MLYRGLLTLTVGMGLLASPAWSQSQTDSSIPTIPESQLEPSTVSSPYEFLSAATSVDDFQIKAGTLALQRAQSPEVKDFAAKAVADHQARMQEAIAAGKADNVEIAAPSPDGEQQGLLNKLEAATATGFDRLYMQTQVFVHQRAMALYAGYAKGESNLNKFAAEALSRLKGSFATAARLEKELTAKSSVQ